VSVHGEIKDGVLHLYVDYPELRARVEYAEKMAEEYRAAEQSTCAGIYDWITDD
jgi:hypothetical protein